MRVWCVRMVNDVGDVPEVYILAEDCESAAWQAQQLSTQRQCTLRDVILHE